jgi:O-acetyl-ADP-ribose deacetylase (regulator of RNase III)
MQTLTNPVNCIGVMGAGLARQFKQRFPTMFVEYAERCRRGLVRLGEPYLYKTPDTLPWILNFPTKHNWKDLSEKESIVTGLRHLAQHYEAWGVTSLAVPSLGCGLGGLSWKEIEPILTQHLAQMRIPVELYVL